VPTHVDTRTAHPPEVLIDSVTLSGASSYTSATFVAETYSKLTLEISGTETSGSFEPVLALGGLSSPSSGAARLIYVSSVSQTVFDNATTTVAGIIDAAGADFDGIIEVFPLTTGRRRHFFARWSSSGTAGYCHGVGRNSDTANGVTSVGWTGSTSFTGTVKLWGMPVVP
jgi:hypothetical protein